jgi:molybdopterin molybdotransferase
VRLFTGSPLPAGADAVVMQEDTRVEADLPADVFVFEPAKPWENVRLRGEDVKRGELLFEPGALLTGCGIGLLAAVGESQVQVAFRPRVGLLATGSELREPGEPLEPGQIYESNRLSIARLVENAGGVARLYPIVPDHLHDTRAALEQALGESDAVITCGGVSVGELDFVKEAFTQLGGTLQFWKVAIKPGRPFVFGSLGSKFLFGLPGNPVSALVTCLLLVCPALRRWQGVTDAAPQSTPGVLDEPLVNAGNRRHFVRVLVDRNGRVRSAGVQASHRMKSTARSDGLVDVPPERTLAEGTRVDVLRWE